MAVEIATTITMAWKTAPQMAEEIPRPFLRARAHPFRQKAEILPTFERSLEATHLPTGSPFQRESPLVNSSQLLFGARR